MRDDLAWLSGQFRIGQVVLRVNPVFAFSLHHASWHDFMEEMI